MQKIPEPVDSVNNAWYLKEGQTSYIIKNKCKVTGDKAEAIQTTLHFVQIFNILRKCEATTQFSE